MLRMASISRFQTYSFLFLKRQGFFGPRVPVDNLDGGPVGVSYFGDMDLINPVIVSPDAGGVYRHVSALTVLHSRIGYYSAPPVTVVTLIFSSRGLHIMWSTSAYIWRGVALYRIPHSDSCGPSASSVPPSKDCTQTDNRTCVRTLSLRLERSSSARLWRRSTTWTVGWR